MDEQSVAAALATLAAALAAGLLVRGGAGAVPASQRATRGRGLEPGRGSEGPRRRPAVPGTDETAPAGLLARRRLLVGLFLLGLLGLGLPGRRWALLVVLVATATLVGRLAGQRRRRLAAGVTRRRVLDVCEAVAAELVAGRTPGEALARAAPDWPPLATVVEAERLGAEVPGALRSLARRPGAEDLVNVAAAWQVAHRTGQGLGDAVGRVARDLRAERALRRVVDGELASARSTARLVAILPLASLAMGSGAGGDPWAFLLDTSVGLACLGGGLLLGAAGLAWIEAIAGAVEVGA